MIFHMSHNCGLFDHDELPQKPDKKSIEKNLFHKHYIYDLFDIERMCLLCLLFMWQIIFWSRKFEEIYKVHERVKNHKHLKMKKNH